MAPSLFSMASVAGMLAMLPTAFAGFNPGSGKNVAVYWGEWRKPMEAIMVLLRVD